MQDEQLEAEMTDSLRPLMPRAMPSTRFVHDLEEDVRRAAREEMEQLGIQPAVAFEEVVIELRRLVHLLRETLVPVVPGKGCVERIRHQLQRRAPVVYAQPRRRQRWFLVGSALSVGSLIAALLLRRRNEDEK